MWAERRRNVLMLGMKCRDHRFGGAEVVLAGLSASGEVVLGVM